MMSFFDGLSYATIIYSGVLVLFALVIFGRLDKSSKVFSIYLILAGITELVSNFYGREFGTNLVFLHLFSLIEMTVLGIFFIIIFNKLKIVFSTQIVVICAVMFIVLNTIFIQPIDMINTYSATLVSMILIFFSVKTFVHLLNTSGKIYQSDKWLIFGIFIYHMTSIIIMFSANLLFTLEVEPQIIIWTLRALILFFTKVIFTYALYTNAFLKLKTTK